MEEDPEEHSPKEFDEHNESSLEEKKYAYILQENEESKAPKKVVRHVEKFPFKPGYGLSEHYFDQALNPAE